MGSGLVCEYLEASKGGNPTSYTLHPTPYTLHPTPYTLHPTPHTLHLTTYILSPNPSKCILQPSKRNPKP
jgi:hypothetical protein